MLWWNRQNMHSTPHPPPSTSFLNMWSSMREKSKSEWPTWISTPCEESVQSTSISFTLSFLGENKKISISHPGQHTPPLNTYSYTFDPTPDIPLYMTPPPQLRANKRNDTEVYVCVQQAASSYNNIALWRSPERTGKCCLCVSTRGLVGGGHWMLSCLHSLNNRPHGVEGGGWERPGGGGGGVQRGHCTPASFTFGVNKVWKPASVRINAPESHQRVHEPITWTTDGWIRVKKNSTMYDVCDFFI